jgi:flagellin-like protein
MLNKKAVSPLIATVLLVMIVVSIGAAVMVVIQGLTEEQITNVETQSDLIACGSEVDVELIEIDQVYRICKNITSQTNGTITLLMENSGLKQITGFKVIVYGDDGFNSTTYTSENLDKGELQGFQFNFGGVGDYSTELSRIEINPQITGRETVTCKEPNLQFDEEFIDALSECGAVTWDSTAAGITVMTS